MGPSSAGYDFVKRLGEAGLLDSRFLFVHGAGLTEHELALLREAGASVCATPEGELNTGLGHPVTGRARDAGVKNGLGVDSVLSVRGDLFMQMRMALYAERAHRNARLEHEKGIAPRKVPMDAAEVFALATTGGAAAAGLDARVGRLADGMQADVVLLRRTSFGLSLLADPVASVVTGANASDVDTVLIAGRPKKRAGKLLGVDRAALDARLADSRDRIIAAASVVDRTLVESAVARAMRIG
jgi:cytosine/adenosine deaminase-related metal-dependent hydrolase